MGRYHRLVAIVAATAAALFGAGSTAAAVSCEAPKLTAAQCIDSRCDSSPVSRDCAMACAPKCAAVVPALAPMANPGPPLAIATAIKRHQLATRHIGPEPPPPRIV